MSDAPSTSATPDRATLLEPFAEGLWTVTRKQRFLGLETGTRMTVARLEGGGLFVHAPVALDEPTRRAIDELGEVRAVVAPSLFHHLYVGQWMQAYPKATFAPCPGLREKRADLSWGPTLGDAPHEAWASTLDQAPFTARFEREVVFYHRATKTFVCADALIHLSTHESLATRVVAGLMRNTGPGKGWVERFAVRDHGLGRAQVERILSWDIEGLVLAHGALVPRGGHAAILDAYRWLGPRLASRGA